MFIFILKHLEILIALSPPPNLSDVGSVISKLVAGLGEAGKEQWLNKQHGTAWLMPHFYKAGNKKIDLGYIAPNICRHTSWQEIPGLRSGIKLTRSFGGSIVQPKINFKVGSGCSGACLAKFWTSPRISSSLAQQSVPVLNCCCCKYLFSCC